MKRILVAPLNWGLGHATRCIPIINSLSKYGYEPILASDGFALDLLKKEFPQLTSFELPSYNIQYSKKANNFNLKLFLDAPHFIRTMRKEKKVIADLVSKEHISGIISDNRFGVRHSNIPSIYITHQLQVLSGSTTRLSSYYHQQIINRFDRCWVPDFKESINLSGKLGRCETLKIPIDYIGPISRFNKQEVKKKHHLLVLLSGPEPQRTMLENKLFEELSEIENSTLFVRGLIEEVQKKSIHNNITIYNYMTAQQLEIALNSSEIILSRSGYTTVMDLAKLGKKAFFIPTPGQSEQEYLAQKLEKEGIIPYRSQTQFSLKDLEQTEDYSGFNETNNRIDYKNLFSLFKSK